jgi:plastocyanin
MRPDDPMRRTRASFLMSLLITAGACVTASPASAAVTSYTLKSKSITVGPYQTVRDGGQVPAPRVGGFVVGMEVHVVDVQTGQDVPQYEVMLHHLIAFDQGRFEGQRVDGECPTHHSGQRFYGTSEELRPLSLPSGYGYPIGARDVWTMGWMLMNHRPDVRTVKIQYRVMVVTGTRLIPVMPYWLNVVPCKADPQYTVPGDGTPGSTATRPLVWRVPASGRIVALGGHMHGGARSLTLDQPRCGARLYTAQPTYASADDPLYHVFPVMHEPDPKNIRWWQSSTGIPIVRGERLVVGSNYDAQFPRMRVMGIVHMYVALGQGVTHTCQPQPADAQTLGPDFAGGRTTPPHSDIQLAAQRPDGMAFLIARPPGSTVTLDAGASVHVSSFSYGPANLSIPQGATVTWRFHGRLQHDATLADGPQGFASRWASGGASYQHTFTVPGTYRIYCSLHPTQMSEVIEVR